MISSVVYVDNDNYRMDAAMKATVSVIYLIITRVTIIVEEKERQGQCFFTLLCLVSLNVLISLQLPIPM